MLHFGTDPSLFCTRLPPIRSLQASRRSRRTDPVCSSSAIGNRRHRNHLPSSPQTLFCDTVSKLRNAHNRRITLLHKLVQTRQLVPRQPESILDNLLVHVSLDLKQNLADVGPARPVVETTLSLTHTLVVSGGVDTNVGGCAVVEAVFHASKALLDRLVGDFELLRGNTSIVVL